MQVVRIVALLVSNAVSRVFVGEVDNRL